MFDIDRELEEIRNINVFPSKELIESAKDLIKKRSTELREEQKRRRKKRIRKFTTLSMLPAAAAILFAVVLSISITEITSRYSLEIESNIVISADEGGIVRDIEYDNKNADEYTDSSRLKGESVEYAVSEILLLAQERGQIDADENIIIGCFGEDEYNNISKNMILSYLDDDLVKDINLMSIYGTMDDLKEAERLGVLPQIFALSVLDDKIDISKDISLDELILQFESNEGTSIEEVLERYEEPIVYMTPDISYYIDSSYVNLTWDFVDFKSGNYDGYITYQAIASNQAQAGKGSYDVIGEYTFAVWEEQPSAFSFSSSKLKSYSYFGVAALYDDGTWVINGELKNVK